MTTLAPADDAAARAFVSTHLSDAIAAFPADVRDALHEKFVAEYSDPHTAQLECVLRKRLTDDEVRHLQFAPTPAQYRFYADVLSICVPLEDGTEDAASWQAVVRKRFLTLFYLKHARNWPLVVECVLRDGLQILVNLFLHSDLQVRGQAIDSFVQITSNPTAFEWFDDPVGYEARALHAKMIALAAPDATFLPRIIANIRLYERDEGDENAPLQRLPGGTFVLLQVLAFFLSWVRKFYTRNELRLSRELLDLLRDWKQRTRSDNDDELRLAQQVFDDFSRWPAIDEVETHLSGLDPSMPVFSVATVDKLLTEQTDEALDRAIALCSDAIDANVDVAEARLARARALSQRIRNAKGADDARQCLDDCTAVLAHDPSNMRAWQCQLSVFEVMERWADGRDVLDAWHSTSRGQFVAEDEAFLAERRMFFDEKAHDEQQRQAREKRVHATRAAKEQEIFRLLLQRSQHHSLPSEAQEQRRLGTTKAESSRAPKLTPSASNDVLARFRSASTTKKSKPKGPSTTDAPLSDVVKARAFVRKFTQCKRDVHAVRSLLQASDAHDVMAAMDAALPEESLLVVLEALVERPQDEVSKEAETVMMRMLQHLLSLPRFALMREMASPTQQQQIDDLVHRANDMLETALAA